MKLSNNVLLKNVIRIIVRECAGSGLMIRLYLICFLFLVNLCIYENNVFSQEVRPKPVRQMSLEAFSKGDYAQALEGFNELLVLYPGDPLYKYYAAVSLVRLERDTERAVMLLDEALRSTYAIREIPSDALFWLGRAQQLSGRYTDAVSSYDKFSETAGRKTARKLGVQKYIKESKEGIGKTTHAGETKELPAQNYDHESRYLPERIPENSTAEGNSDLLVRERECLPGECDSILTEALIYQAKADSVLRLADEIRNNPDSTQILSETELTEKLTKNEAVADSLQKQADIRYGKAHLAIEELNNIQKENGNDVTLKITEPEPSEKLIKDVELTEKGEQLKNEKTELYQSFKLIENPVYDLNEKIVINPDIPDGLIYRIQLGVFRNEVTPPFFKGITPVYGFKQEGADLTGYYAGVFRRKDDAGKALLQVRQKGFRDAFIVAFSDGKVISADRAAVLEDDWGKKPFSINDVPIEGTSLDTLPPTLSFRVEIMRSPKPVDEEMKEGFEKISTGRGLDIWQLNDGTVVYLIGNFITFESAEEYASLLSRNGYEDAKVGAWLGKKEVPLETARQLFERLE